ncbi:MAG: hypothetical protein IKT98_09675 [Selenomonadaceae bacterium]|nr:hypothetical protein [Selenomonadaceae bacterium]
MSAEFIKMISEVHKERFNVHLSELIKNQTPCGIFFGFDFNPNWAAANVQMLIKTNLNVACVVVISVVQEEPLKSLVEVPIIPLEEIASSNLKTIFLFGNLKDFAFTSYFARHGIEVLQKADDSLFSFTMDHLPELYSVYEMLGSNESRKVFCASIKGNLTGKINDYRFAQEPQYFLDSFTPNADDIAIDGGSFDGATSIDFSTFGAKVFAFEMDAINYKNCQDNINVSGGVRHYS